MPSRTLKQARFMAAVAHNPEFARKVGVPQSVGEEFNAADEAAGSSTDGILSKPKRKRRVVGVLSRSFNA